MIDQVFERLVTTPAELNPTVSEVLIAGGRFIGAILKEGYDDKARQLRWTGSAKDCGVTLTGRLPPS